MPSLLRPTIPFHNINIRQISSQIMSTSPTCHEIGVNKPYFANFEVRVQARARQAHSFSHSPFQL
jgi:hypothetical protein